MSGRRRYERFSIGQPWLGRLRVLHDVTVLGVGDDRTVEVIGPVAGVPGEVIVLDAAGRRTSIAMVACVTDSRPVVVDGAVSHALRLLVLDETRRAEPGPGAVVRHDLATRCEVLAADDAVSVMVRESDIHVVNVSGSGCLIESAANFDEGTTATLALTVGTDELSDAVRVTRCRRIQGAGSRYLVGAEFLWTTAPRPGSVRRAAHGWSLGGSAGVEMTGSEPPLLM